MSNIPVNYTGIVNLKALPSLAWPEAIAASNDAMRNRKAHEVIDDVTDTFVQFGQAIAAMDNFTAPSAMTGKPSTEPRQMDYNPEKGHVVLVEQYVGDAGKKPAVAELNFDPKSGTVYRFAVMMDEKNQYICEGAHSSNPTFIRIEDGHKTSVSFNTGYQQITNYYAD